MVRTRSTALFLTSALLLAYSTLGFAQGGASLATAASRTTRQLAGGGIGSAAPRRQAPDGAPTLKVGILDAEIHVDGRLDEPAWQGADAIPNLTMVEPTQGGAPSMRTMVKVLANSRVIVFGVRCEDPNPDQIVRYTKQRDAAMSAEDHIELILDPFMDGRSGYAFWVNPKGARYDALINPGGASVNANWDGIWEAATTRDDKGWTAEIRVPIRTLNYKKGLRAWHFNIQRRIQRRQETDRWTAASPDYKVTQVSRAGLLTGLPDFELDIGLTVRPSLTGGGGVPELDAPAQGDLHASLDVTQRLGPNLLASGSANTDFADTDPDTWRTNLTRFSLYYPEKRAFFLEGSDIFQFGSGLGTDVVPFFSRTIGLVDGQQVPILAAGKLSGRIDDASLGAVVVRTRSLDGVAPAATMGAFRVKQNLFGESSIGAIATVGDPSGASGSWLAGADFTYQTSHFQGDKNFLVGLWGAAMGRPDVAGDKTAAGFQVAYPNDRWNVTFIARRVGDGFQPSLGFVPRPGIYSYALNGEYDPRPSFWNIRQMFNEFRISAITDLHGAWESYRFFFAPVNWRFESGDRVEFNWAPAGDVVPAPFEVAEGVVIPPGPYHWTRWRLEVGTAAKRTFSAQATWWFGTFYSGKLDQLILTSSWNPTALLTMSLNAERDIGRLKEGDFTATLLGARFKFNVSPDLSINSFVQYDTGMHSIGTNTRVQWTFRPAGDLFVIYNHNLTDITDRWRLESNQLLVKMQYSFRY